MEETRRCSSRLAAAGSASETATAGGGSAPPGSGTSASRKRARAAKTDKPAAKAEIGEAARLQHLHRLCTVLKINPDPEWTKRPSSFATEYVTRFLARRRQIQRRAVNRLMHVVADTYNMSFACLVDAVMLLILERADAASASTSAGGESYWTDQLRDGSNKVVTSCAHAAPISCAEVCQLFRCR